MNELYGPPHIGKEIDKRIEEVGMSKAEFGRRIHTSRQNVNTLLRKRDLPAEQLLQISNVLNKNFFACYVDRLPKRLRASEDTFFKKDVIRVQVELNSPDDLQDLEKWWRVKESGN